MSQDRARNVLNTLNVPPQDMDEEMIETTIGFLAAYDKLDLDKNGTLTRAEFKAAAKKLNPKEDPEKFMMLCDLDADGIITQSEFIRAFVIAKISDRHCATFKEFDTNGDGKIDRQELRQALQSRGYDQSKIDELFNQSDVDSSGFISYYEFSLSILKGTIKLEK